MRYLTRFVIIVGLVLISSSTFAKKKNPLDGQPAIRHRHEMRTGRFEVGPSFGFSLNRALRHAITFGLKAEYHINDFFSVGLDFGFGVGVDTGLASEIKDRYSTEPTTWDLMQKRFSNIRMSGDLRAVFTPISGKMGIFSKLFIGYDMYAFAGLGLALLSNDFDGAIAEQDAVSEGFRAGPAFGLGIHLYFTKYFSMGLEIKDLVYLDNESGGDLTRGLTDKELASATNDPTKGILIDGDDSEFLNHWFVGINFTFFIPFKPTISN